MANGTGGEAHHYLGFGDELTPVTGEKLLFTGHERDHGAPGAADDLDYMLARYYSPFSARFTSPDPVLGSVENPQSWNRYAYTLNNPLNFVDPDGRVAFGVAKTLIKLAIKGGDVAATVAGAIDDAKTVLDSDAPVLDRIGAGVSLASEIFSPVSGRDIKTGARSLGVLDGGKKEVIRVTEPGKAKFQLTEKGQEGISVFDSSKVTPEEVLPSFREGSQTVTRRVEEIEAVGLIVEPTKGAASLPKKLQDAHMDILPGPDLKERREFKKALKKLE